ncbi:hypothetical protein B0H15DRAFT_835494 [Mycena belliarum]|uniref:NADAR domain-containing protein n=1 Tax=Mycena belliarum TaxID=1033014 RepID=A0AAD6UAT2_9AGAR|nr:hypothetical protein B0H15DRAFT_835494 [Mycena belliae]
MQQLTLAQAFARTAPKKASATKAPEASSSNKPSGSKKPPSSTKPAVKVLFGANGPHANFDQFSVHPVTYNGWIYPTSQHLFQAFKFLGHRADIAEKIRTASTAEDAFNLARSNRAAARPDWLSINLAKMEEALSLKFSQHPHLQKELLSTGDSELYQDSLTDSFWGVGSDLLGRNELGRALERVRERLGGTPAPVRKILFCQNCHKKPRVGQSLYCGETCLRADISTIAPLCPQCRRRPQIGKLKYCGDTCRKAARG